MFAWRRASLALSVVWVCLLFARSARADGMQLALSRLSVGDCAGTLAAPPRLTGPSGPALATDEAAFGRLMSELSSSVAPSELGPVTGAGPRGLELALDTQVGDLDEGADAWRRGTRGDGSATCDGRNQDVRSLLVSNRLRFEKGLPLGLGLGGSIGRVHASGTYLVGLALKLALLEDAWHGRLPDLALRGTLTSLVGEPSLTLFVSTFDLLLSRRFVLAPSLVLSPFAGGGVLWTRAHTRAVDLTPNLDASGCAAGTFAGCGPLPTGADRAHDVSFGRVSLLRGRAFAGLSLRHRWLALAASATIDLARPRLGVGTSPSHARQWTVALAPVLLF